MTHDGDGMDGLEPLTSCTGFEEDLSALIDGELDAHREAEVRNHLDSCAECTEVLSAFQEVDGILAGLPAPALSGDVGERLVGLVRTGAAEDRESATATDGGASGDTAPISLETHRRRRSTAPWVGAVIGALAASLVLFVALRPGEVERGGGPGDAQIEADLLATELDSVEDLEMLEVLDLLEDLAREAEPQVFEGEVRSS